MDFDEHSLPLDCWIYIFSFLHDDDLITASGVSKEWHEAAETPWLWREMCLQRWGFCNLAQFLSNIGKHTWKSYYLRRSQLELKMKTGRSGGYTCKSLRGHTGRVVGIVYLVGNTALSDFWNCTPVVCSASTDGTVRAWDVQKGVQLWSSPVQSHLCDIISDPHHGVVITSDTTGTIKAWEGLTGQETASFSSASPQCTLLSYNINGSYFLSVGTSQGSLITMTSPSLSKLSNHVVCDTFSVNILLSSPDKKWILAATKENIDVSPKVFSSQSLCSSEGEAALCQNLPVSGCYAAAFLPSQSARVAVIHSNGLSNSKVLSIFNICMKKCKYDEELQVSVQQIEAFQLELNRGHSDIILQAKGNSSIVVADANHLKVYTLKGVLVTSFKDHTQPISSLCVDSFRVVTASRDLSLRVLTWKNEKEKGLTLESQYHLLGGSHTMSRGFTHVACDYASIVASVESVDGKDVLKAYTFDS